MYIRARVWQLAACSVCHAVAAAMAVNGAAFKRLLLSKLPPVWLDETDWVALLPGIDAAGRAYFARPGSQMTPLERVARATSGLALMQKNHPAAAAAGTAFVFRAGNVATCGPLSFLRLLHAAAAGLVLGEMAAMADPLGRPAMKAAGRVWRHLAAAQPWAHGDAVRPPQLAPAEVARAKACLYFLAYANAPERAPAPAMKRAACRRNVALLQMLDATAARHLPALAAWAAKQLKTEVAHAWALHHSDPRSGLPAVAAGPERLYAVFKIFENDLGREVPVTVRRQLDMMGSALQPRVAAIEAEQAAATAGLGLYLSADVRTDHHARHCPVAHLERLGVPTAVDHFSALARGPF